MNPHALAAERRAEARQAELLRQVVRYRAACARYRGAFLRGDPGYVIRLRAHDEREAAREWLTVHGQDDLLALLEVERAALVSCLGLADHPNRGAWLNGRRPVDARRYPPSRDVRDGLRLALARAVGRAAFDTERDRVIVARVHDGQKHLPLSSPPPARP